MEKSSRPVRNRKQSRRAWPPGDIHRPVKRLFTPDIKKMLKDWLVRRRENPYPSRDEKKTLAYETGLTYTQIANWFANWRRKLKNSGHEPVKKSWGNLIKNYNTSAKGNVEQFSISSCDSIWNEQQKQAEHERRLHYQSSSYSSTSYDNENDIRKIKNCLINDKKKQKSQRFYTKCSKDLQPLTDNSDQQWKYIGIHPQCFQISSTTTEDLQNLKINNIETKLNDEQIHNKTKYKHKIIEKYYRDTNNPIEYLNNSNYSSSLSSTNSSGSPELSKWLESTANFQPNKNNYIEWNQSRNKFDKKQIKSNEYSICETSISIHQKEELDAAEALANLACNYRQRMMNLDHF